MKAERSVWSLWYFSPGAANSGASFRSAQVITLCFPGGSFQRLSEKEIHVLTLNAKRLFYIFFYI